jgi:sporulation protein YlmC with PRC-barrel domain
MRKLAGTLVVIALLGIVIPAAAQQTPLVDTYSVLGSPVKGGDGKDLGKINQLMMDPKDGRIVYAVVAVGGMLGVGEKLVAVPWNALKLGQAQGKLIVTIDRALLEQSPAMSSPSASPSTDPNKK